MTKLRFQHHVIQFRVLKRAQELQFVLRLQHWKITSLARSVDITDFGFMEPLMW